MLPFMLEMDKEEFGLKPMNCPGHCLMYNQQPRTHNELPIRFADFGVIHRHELSGSISGLTRVRRFQQDDAHIFCRKDQIAEEIKGCLDFLLYCYRTVFGFDFKFKLSTRPENFLGEIALWNEAEDVLEAALNESGKTWELSEGDGAFYGPKIDVTIEDSLGRSHQCATVQLDFQLAQRFDLYYFDESGDKRRPVMIHRAILGSLERFIAIVLENCNGKLPFWLSPRQVEFNDCFSDTIDRQIRKAIQAQFNFVLVVGPREMKNRSVNVRTRDSVIIGEVSLEKLISAFRLLDDKYIRQNEGDKFMNQDA